MSEVLPLFTAKTTGLPTISLHRVLNFRVVATADALCIEMSANSCRVVVRTVVTVEAGVLAVVPHELMSAEAECPGPVLALICPCVPVQASVWGGAFTHPAANGATSRDGGEGVGSGAVTRPGPALARCRGVRTALRTSLAGFPAMFPHPGAKLGGVTVVESLRVSPGGAVERIHVLAGIIG